ncbi:MAG: hypothetical protein J6A29_02755 [Clostridia bacterium]|nr:hypothetical protein [Clostridia bacterium]
MLHPHMVTAAGALRQSIAQVMTQRTGYTISAYQVNFVLGEDRRQIFSAQVGDVTVLCWARGDEFIIKTVNW